MAVNSRGRTTTEEDRIPMRLKACDEPVPRSKPKVVPVVYYLSKDGQLEHPHFMEVHLHSSSEGLYLRDVINRLNFLRGKGMASMYSWSSKRSYRSGFVWHDLSEHDLIHPAHGQEYVLKGSELLLLNDEPSRSHESTSSSSKLRSETHKSDDEFPVPVNQRQNQSWSSNDLHEHKVFDRINAADAATQTDEKRRHRKTVEIQSVELSRDEISPPPSDSSPETLASLMKADGRLVLFHGSYNDDENNRTVGNCPSGRLKATAVIKQLISCGAVSFKDCGALGMKDQGLSLMSHNKVKVCRDTGNRAEKEVNFERVRLEDKEYFSGSLIETKKDEFVSLKRSSSYNPERHVKEGREVKVTAR